MALALSDSFLLSFSSSLGKLIILKGNCAPLFDVYRYVITVKRNIFNITKAVHRAKYIIYQIFYTGIFPVNTVPGTFLSKIPILQ
jgi:hypothetical protein